MPSPVAVQALAISATLTLMQSAHADPLLLDLSSPEVIRAFRVINDSVMGGISASRLSLKPGFRLFEGEVSLENNGGVASFRGPVRFPAETAALLLTVPAVGGSGKSEHGWHGCRLRLPTVLALLNFNQLVVVISLGLSAWPDAGSRPRNLSAASSASSTVGATQVKWPIFRPRRGSALP